MNAQALPLERAALKEPTGWFAAGRSFRHALTLLSDGAFKLFAHICLEADRRTGRFVATQKELAAALGKSKRIIGRYVAELETTHICKVMPASNQHARTTFEVCESFWPYYRGEADEPPELRQYVDSVRDCYTTLGGCTNGGFGASENAAARNLYDRRIPIGVVRDALLTGACRKYASWLNGAASEPIRSLRYFEGVIAELQEQPLPPGYSGYLGRKVEKLAAEWAARPASAHPSVPGCAPGAQNRGGSSTASDLLGKKGNQQTQI